MAKKFDGKITLIHIYSVGDKAVVMTEPTTPNVPIMAPADFTRVMEAVQEAGEEILAHGRKIGEAEDVPIETFLKEGHNVKEILRTARDGGFDLIVMGAKGVSRIREILLGSVSEGVIRNASCPVLVTK